MSTVDEAVEAGAESAVKFLPLRLTAGFTPAFRVGLGNAWPILSAGLRELHVDHECTDWRKCSIIFGGRCGKVGHCADCGYAMPCRTVRELDRIDQELGIGSGGEGYCTCNGSNAGGLMGDCGIAAHRAEWRERHQSGGPCSRQYPEVGHEDGGYSCSTHNMPWGECPHQSGEPESGVGNE